MPTTVQEFFLSGHAIDLILGLLIVEAVTLSVYHRATKRGIPVSNFIANLLSGGLLLLALRAALVGWSPAWIGLFLVGGFAAHLADLRCRAKRT